MSYCVSYRRLNNYNINHLYSIKEFVPEARRFQRIYNPALLSYNLSEARQKAWMKKRLYEHDDEYDIDVPRAPAFRTASSREVEDVVRRLTRPSTHKAKPRQCKRYRKGFARYSYEDEPPPEGPLRSARDIKEMVDRLSKPRNSCDRKHYHHSMPELYNYEDDFELTPVSD